MVADIVLGTIAVVTVDVLGAEKEIDQLSTTCAALHWLHCIDNEGNMVAPRGIHLNFVGPEVPCDWKLIDPSPDHVKLNFEAYPKRGYNRGGFIPVWSPHTCTKDCITTCEWILFGLRHSHDLHAQRWNSRVYILAANAEDDCETCG